MMTLRPYQTEAVKAALKIISNNKHPLIVLPTGSGKSLCIAELTRQLNAMQTLIITPRIKLLKQNANLLGVQGLDTGIMSASISNDNGESHSIICGTYQTLIRRDIVEPNVIIVDEAHLIPEDDSEYASLLARFPKAIYIGLTATPFRKRASIINNLKSRLCWTKAFELSMLDLIKQGYLTPPRSFLTHAEISADENNLANITSHIIRSAHNKLNSLGCKRALVFCKSIQHTNLTVAALSAIGSPAKAVHSEIDDELDNVLDWFESEETEIRYLVSCNMLLTGIDLPITDGIVLLRRFSSPGTYIQTVGRGSRVYKNKMFTAVLDYGHNRERFGFVDKPILGDIEKQPASHNMSKCCPQCEAINTIGSRQCIHCQFEFEFKNTLEYQSNDKQMLSIDLRADVVKSIVVNKNSNSMAKITYHFQSGDTAIKFSSTPDGEYDNIGQSFLYRVSSGISRVVKAL